MTVRIFAGYTFGATIPSATITVTEATGSLDLDITCDGNGIQYDDGGAQVDDADTQWCHYNLSGVLGTGIYDDFAGALKGVLDEASLQVGNTWTYTVTFNASAYTYTISAAEGNTALTFSGTPGSRMRNLLGFTANQGSAASHTSDMRPYYVVIPQLGSRSKLTTYREPGNLIGGAIASDGTHYSIHPQSLPKHYEWTHEFEQHEGDTIAGAGTGVFIQEHGDTLVPWTWEHFFQHVRASEPFGLLDSTTEIGDELFVHYLRPEHAHFAPKRRQVDWDKWDIEMRTFWEGTEY